MQWREGGGGGAGNKEDDALQNVGKQVWATTFHGIYVQFLYENSSYNSDSALITSSINVNLDNALST